MATDMDGGLIAQLTALALLVQGARERRAREHDLSPTVARLLSALADGAPTMNELAGRLGLDKSSTSGLVDRAQRRGLVRRLPSQLDRRSVRVRLTPAGRALEQSLAEQLATDVRSMLEPLRDEARQALSEPLRAILSAR